MNVNDVLQKLIANEMVTKINYNDSVTGTTCTAYLYNNVVINIDSGNGYIDLLIKVNQIKDLLRGFKTVNRLLAAFIQSDDIRKFSIMLWAATIDGNKVRILTDDILNISDIQLGIA